MSLFTVLLIVLIILALGGSFGGYYPHTYGIGLGTILLIVLIVLLLR
jgi:hypothetical protein